jgi:hypothetical protein
LGGVNPQRWRRCCKKKQERKHKKLGESEALAKLLLRGA